MNPTIDLSFRYSAKDYVRAVRQHQGSRFRLTFDVAFAVVLATIGAILWAYPHLYWLGVACVALAAFFILILIAALTVIPHIVFRREPKFRDEYSMSFSSDGIHFRTAYIDSMLQWSLYSRAIIDDHSYLLYYSRRQFTIIPKRVFENAAQEQAFDQLLRQHISRIY